MVEREKSSSPVKDREHKLKQQLNVNDEEISSNKDKDKSKKETLDLINETINNLLVRLLPKNFTDRSYVTFKESEIKLVCQLAIEVLKKEKSLVPVSAPVYVCGDIHGQYYDLLRIFNCCSQPGQATYLFLGDYVDRGKQSLETIMLLLIYKIKFPKHIILLRGNHEAAAINKIYGFYDECKNRVSLKSWKTFCDVFSFLPIAALIDEKILCMHGGLGPDLESVSQINNIKRPCDVPDEGIVCDLLWADPSDEGITDYSPNERGISVTFNSKVVKQFLEKNELDLIVRAHQVVEEGYEFFANQTLVTVFSAPNYTGEFDNNGSVMYADVELMCSFQILKPSMRLKREKKKDKAK